MKHATSESDMTSLATTSPPRTPKRPAYYVQSPPHDDGDKSSTAHTTPAYNNSPLESPSHPSTARHSRISSASRCSGTFPRSSPPATRKLLGPNSSSKGWRQAEDAIDEEGGAYDDGDDEPDDEEDPRLPRFFAAAFWLSVLVLLLTALCLVVWGVARHYNPTVIVKSLTVHDLYAGEGTDRTGVPTKLVTLNCSLKIDVHNPSTMSGIHVSSSSIRLMFSEIAIASGQIERFYQPRRSHRVASVVVHGEKTPLYGAGATLGLTNNGGTVPLTLEMAVRGRGYVFGRLVRVSHAKRVKSPVVIDSSRSKPVRFSRNACSYT